MVQPYVDLVILRHGEAEAYAGSDAERRLTDQGEDESKQQIAHLAASGFMPELIVHSPFVRTRQTAEICARLFPSAEVLSHSALMHSADPQMVPFLWSEVDSILLVSHMPLVARLCNYLCPAAEINGFSVSGFVRLRMQRNDLEAELVVDASRGLS